MLTATAQVLAGQGYAALNFQDVAKLARVSRTTMYRRWPSRAELAIDAITAAASERIATPDTGALATDLTVLLRSLGSFIASPLGVAALAAGLEVGADGQFAREAFWKKRFGDLAPIFERAQARGELPADLDVEAALAMVTGAVYSRFLVSTHTVDDAWIRRVVTAFCAGR